MLDASVRVIIVGAVLASGATCFRSKPLSGWTWKVELNIKF